MSERQQTRETSMAYWWPQLGFIPELNLPLTALFSVDFALLPTEDEIPPGSREQTDRLIACVAAAAQQFGGYPLFLRTDYASGKFSWGKTCYCESAERIRQCFWGLVMNTYEIGFPRFVPFDYLVAREFLPLRSSFTAFDGMPIAREFRVFYEDGGSKLHIQPYWPPGSIRDGSLPDWRERLVELSTITEEECELLRGMARRVGDHLGGNWSIDFSQHEDGRWFLTDMARAELSYKWNPETGEDNTGQNKRATEREAEERHQ